MRKQWRFLGFSWQVPLPLLRYVCHSQKVLQECLKPFIIGSFPRLIVAKPFANSLRVLERNSNQHKSILIRRNPSQRVGHGNE